MNPIYALAIAVLFGVGGYLMLKRDLMRVVVGTMLISNGSFLLIIAAGLLGQNAPIHPLETGVQEVADPLVQALALTAIVISFGVTNFLLILIYCFSEIHESLDQLEHERAERIEEAEEEEDKQLLREEGVT